MKEPIQLTGKQLSLRRERKTTSLFLLSLILLTAASLFMLRAVTQGQIASPFKETPVPTRASSSFALEGETQFNAGNLPAAIEAYRKATQLDPSNALLWSELARIQSYSSATLATDAERRDRMADALASINTAVKLAPEDGSVHAFRAFVLDWSANPVLAGNQSQALLTEAEQEAVRGLQLDNQNPLGLAYYAEILVDQQKWVQAEQIITQAKERGSNLMDVHRVAAVVQESLANYAEAIRSYKRAAELAPNMTFLYISIGANYRQLRQYEVALEWFAKAATINKQLGISDPIPYLAIGKTYSQIGEFFAAARNVRTALDLTPRNPEVYGSLGVVYFKSRNYEGAIPALKCAVRGCDAQTSCEVRQCKDAQNPAIVITNVELNANTAVYYYTYGSVLAGMHRPYNNYCEEGVKVLREVRQAFSGDKDIIAIITPSEQICASFGYK